LKKYAVSKEDRLDILSH